MPLYMANHGYQQQAGILAKYNYLFYLMAVSVTAQAFGEFEGRIVNKYTITESTGIQVSVINYGAIVTSINVPDKNGRFADVVLGFENMKGYINTGHFYFGGICGRYANRIADGRFQINGQKYQLSKNNDIGCLHGGFKGFDKKYWEAEVLPEGNGVMLTYKSRDGEEGFPGNLDVTVTYRVMENALQIEYRAVTDKATPVNLTNHSYFNLSGGSENNILDHTLRINADHIVEVGESFIPKGKLLAVADSPVDFNVLKRIGSGNEVKVEYDYSWVLNKQTGELAEAASLVHTKSGRCMTVFTTQPAIHFYSGNFLDGKMTDTKNGHVYSKYAGLCLETQHFPDSPNHPEFPDTIIHPGDTYSEITIFRFSIINDLITKEHE